MTKKFCNLVFLGALILVTPGRALAENSGRFFGYNLGYVYSTTTSYASISYDAPIVSNLPQDCSESVESNSMMRCQAYLAPDTSGASDSSVFIEEPFKRQGLFYFEPAFTFSTLSYKGGLGTKPKSPLGGASKSSSSLQSSASTSASSNSSGEQVPADGEQPLTKAYIEAYGINWQGYLRFGLTPRYLPDVLFKLGLGVQTVGGRLKIFKEEKIRYVIQPSAFGEIALVLVRVSTGALSVFVGEEQTLSGPLGSKLISDYPGGTNLRNFQLGLMTGSAGVRVLFPF
jgi:hypothetical protein